MVISPATLPDGVGRCTPTPPTKVRTRTLTTGWRWVLAGGWGTVMAGIGMLANTGFLTGSPPFWLDWALIPFALPVAVLIALAVDWSHTIALSFVAVGGHGGDRPHRPARRLGDGRRRAAVRAVALLVTVSAMAGRVPADL